MVTMTKVHGTKTLEEMSDEKLKRRFASLYVDVHIIGQSGWKNMVLLGTMEDELIERGYDPAEVIGPKVI